MKNAIPIYKISNAKNQQKMCCESREKEKNQHTVAINKWTIPHHLLPLKRVEEKLDLVSTHFRQAQSKSYRPETAKDL